MVLPRLTDFFVFLQTQIQLTDMKERQHLEQEQTMTQRLTPQQVQYVRMLEMTAPEIEEKVRREVDDNPALSATDPDEGAEGHDDDSHEGANDNDESDSNETAEEMQRADYASDDDVPFDAPEMPYRAGSGGGDSSSSFPMEANADVATQADSLMAQLAEYTLDDKVRLAASYIIGNIDANGRMTRALSAISSDIAIAEGVEVSQEDMKRAFDVVRSLDPAGIAATDLRDCLLLQLRRRTPKTFELRVATEIVDKNFDLLTHKHYDRLKARLHVDDADLRNAIEVIRSLDPKPGGTNAGEVPDDRLEHITPDFTVEYLGECRFSVSLNQRLPALALEQSFVASVPSVSADTPKMSRADARRRDAALFVRHKVEDANTFISMVQRRNDTLLRVMRTIVSLQQPFFAAGGDERLIRPMILKDIGGITGMDLSVISRACAGKYVATARGVWPLKMFFNERPIEDSDTSTIQILETMRTIISEENPKSPLSDRRICELMAERGAPIARRTVAKYRERLDIPVARLRKKP